ncbi:MAG: hypothetical protein QM608_08110, partial [Caulobacter sp.]
MDISEIISGFRGLDAPGADAVFQQKLSSFELAYKLAKPADTSLDEFLAGVPTGLLSGYLVNDSLDGYFNVLLASALNGRRDADTFLAAVVHSTVLQLTYQGRHRPFPEAYVLGAGGDVEIGEIGLLNTKNVPAYRLDGGAGAMADDRQALALNTSEFITASAIEVPGRLGHTGQPVGCVAFLDVGARVETDEAMSRDLLALASATTAETFYLFAGQADAVARLHERLGAINPDARRMTRFYWHGDGPSAEFRGVVVATGYAGGLELGDWLGDRQVQ